jgi:dihydrolipoamide dehydrogenase
MGRAGGVIRIYADKVDEVLLGAEMVGPGAEHIAHVLAWAIEHRIGIRQLRDSPIYHPSLEEGIKPALREIAHLLHVEQPMSTAL